MGEEYKTFDLNQPVKTDAVTGANVSPISWSRPPVTIWPLQMVSLGLQGRHLGTYYP